MNPPNALVAFKLDVKQLCEWSGNVDGFYDTACGNAHEFITDGPTENGYRYCPYCGKTLTIPPHHQPHP